MEAGTQPRRVRIDPHRPWEPGPCLAESGGAARYGKEPENVPHGSATVPGGRGGDGAAMPTRCRGLLADHAIPVAVAHVPVRRVRAVHRRDPMATSHLAGDPAVPVVVEPREDLIACTGARATTGIRRGRSRAHHRVHRDARAPAQDPLKRRGLGAVDSEPVVALRLEDPSREPAPVPVREPLRRVLAGLLVTVHLGGGEGEVLEIPSEPRPSRPVRRAKAGIVSLARRDDMLNVALPRRGAKHRPVYGPQTAPRARTIASSTEGRVPIVTSPLVGCAAALRRDGEAAPGLRRSGECHPDDAGESAESPNAPTRIYPDQARPPRRSPHVRLLDLWFTRIAV